MNARKQVIAALGVLILLSAYYFFIASRQSNCDVCSVTMASASLHPGLTAYGASNATAELSFTLNNPGSTTYIDSITLTSTNLTSPITSWSSTPAVSGVFNINYWSCPHQVTTVDDGVSTYVLCSGEPTGSPPEVLKLPPGLHTDFSFYPVANASELIRTDQTYNYVINFFDGQSVSGSIIPQ